jgi:hypothetical protein
MKLRIENDWYWPITPLLILALAGNVLLAWVVGLPGLIQAIILAVWMLLRKRTVK